MILYGLRVIPLTREVQEVHLNVAKPWYVDNVGAIGTFPCLQAHFDYIMAWGYPKVYFLDLTKSILVVSAHNVVWADRFLCRKGLTIVTVSRYLGDYIGGTITQVEWLRNRSKDWMRGVNTMLGVERNHPQVAYVGLQKSL